MGCMGCTHHQLAHSTLQQAGTITDLHYKQVLSNIASYHTNAEVLPHFAVVGTGGTSVSDQASANAELEWVTGNIFRQMYVPGASRTVDEQWTMAPVVNPDKLRAMRCLFQLVVFGTTTDRESDQLLKSFLGDNYMEWVQRGWYGVGCAKDVPKAASFVGHDGGKFVWVMPDGVGGLSRLTLVLLNVAALDPNPTDQPTKTVEKYTYKDGKLDTMERYTRPDPDAPKQTGFATRKDFFNPLQTQIQMRGR
jgi:hypothetical protein